MPKHPNRPRVSVPLHAHPHAKLIFALMGEHSVTYDELEYRSGVLRSTLKSYRNEKTPSLQSIEALLGSFGWTLVPVPPLESLPTAAREQLEEVGLHFRSDEETIGAVVDVLARQWRQNQNENGPVPRLARGAPYWNATTA